MTARAWLTQPAALTLFAALCCASVLIGATPIGPGALASANEDVWRIVLSSRLPRLAALILTGAGLAICGVILQQIVRNRFVEPATTGGLGAAKMGMLIALTSMPQLGNLPRMFAALAFCLASSLLFVAAIRRLRLRNAVLVPVIGLMYGSVLNALAEFYAYHNNIMQSMQGWMFGDFSRVVQGNYEVIWIILPIVVASYLFAHRFTIVGMGADMATSLGLSYPAMVTFGLMLVAATIASTIITVGAIPFVGLIIPNLVSLYHGDNLARTLPLIALGGASFLLVCDIAGRLVIQPFEMPIGLTTGLLGGIMFLVLIWRKSR